MRATNLKTDYRTAPLGLDNPSPRFTWNCEGGKKQLAYRVIARCGEDLLWDSGRVKTDSMHCTYAGPQLKSAQRVIWSVKLWDENGEGSPAKSWFETGLLSPGDWMASWICGVGTDQEERLSADCFRKRFRVEKTLRSARLYATACGVYSASVNGHRLPGVLAPGSTEYEKRLHYQVYDVTAFLCEENVLDFTVGDGWFKGKLGSTNTQYFFGNQLKLLAQLVLTFADGTREVIGTDESWLWCNDGPIRYTDLKDGEIYDARMVPSFAHHAVRTEYQTAPVASPAEGIFEHECYTPTLLVSPSGKQILDFGQNLAGYVRFTLRNQVPGTVVRLQLGEVLDHGEFSRTTLLHVLPDLPSTNQEIVYTCAGGTEVFQPEFFYSGFRYALVTGLETVNPGDFEAVAVYSDLSYTGQFHCSNPMLNQFVDNTRWSQKSNFVDVPTDCPQREKSGWTGDAQIFVKTASYFADTAAFYRKWLRDVRDCQREDGRVQNECPKIRGVDERDVLNGSVGWADAAVILPYTLWKLYGDDRFITENDDLLHGWEQYVIHAASDKSYYHLPEQHPLKAMLAPFLLPESPYNQYIIESGLHWGEWLEPGVDGGKELIFPKQEIAAAYMHYSMGLLAEMLNAIGKDEEAALCAEYAEGAKRAYNFHFVKDGKIAAPRQAPMVRALALGLLDEETAQGVAADLNADAVARNYKVGTGFLSTPFVLGVLVKYGYVDTAYRMLENTQAPGWLAMVAQGATTVWENYLAYDEEQHPIMQSMNHYSLGAVCSFLFETVCGIQVAGENRFTVRPVPGGTLTYAEASFVSPYGKISSGWKRVKGQIEYTVEIPANTTAVVSLPDGTSHEIGWGRHQFVC